MEVASMRGEMGCYFWESARVRKKDMDRMASRKIYLVYIEE
jgi:hypothetical protein